MKLIELAAIVLLNLFMGIGLVVALLCTGMLVLATAAFEALENLNEHARRLRGVHGTRR